MFRGLIMGCPGAGKGTQTKRILSKYPITPISTGEILRSHVSQKTPTGIQIASLMESGKLVPDQIATKALYEKLVEIKDSHWILDGYPRTIDQAIILDKFLDDSNMELSLVINLVVPWDVIIDRISMRWIHEASGRTYNPSFNPPKSPGYDDITGEKLVRRRDDDSEIILRRLEEYQKHNGPILEHYKNRGILKEFHGRSSDEITPSLNLCLDNCFNQN
jgi:adenylate kinase